jgi:exocyst complex component 7
MLVQYKSTVHLMVKGDQKAFSELVVQLISSLEFMLDINSRGLQLQGQQQMFLLNNVHFMLQEVKIDSDLGLILGEGWLWQRHDQLNQLVTGYVDASWTPVMSCFQRRTRVPEILWPHQLLDKFTSSFEMT